MDLDRPLCRWTTCYSINLYISISFPARAVYRYNREQQRELKKIQQEIDDETPLTKEEAKEIRDNVRKVTAQFESQLEQRDATIARLKMKWQI
ncbi:hypothetical protein [Janthinobacterium lividum]|uniref:hypothetical protein n=1 Tax=Janthinobacterium lividum TaxID=29581 RepID=UPI000FE25C9D|nr:hypothetical protein [Janthinobacterium lividum]